jgi:hypothetical protein
MNRIRRTCIFSSAALVCLSLATGCAVAPVSSNSIAASVPASSAQLKGRVHGGQQPVTGSIVQLYAVNTSATAGASTALIASTVTTSDGTGVGGNAGNAFNTLSPGSFTITGKYTCPSPNTTPVYMVSTTGNPGLTAGTNNAAIALMAALGPCNALSSGTFIDVDEVTTVAAVWALGSLMTDYAHVGSANAATLTSAFTLASQYANSATGFSPGASVPANTYVPSAKLDTLANIIATCVNSDGSGATGNTTPCGQLFTASQFSNPSPPANTIASAINIHTNPATNVSTLFPLGNSSPPFQPALSTQPSDFTLPLASVSWTTPSAITYGTALSSTQLDASATVAGTFNYTPGSGSTLGAGTVSLGVTFTPTDTADYPTAIPASVNLTINKATPAISWTPAPLSQYAPLTGSQLDATTGLVGGYVYTPALGATFTGTGAQTLSVTFNPTDTSDYNSASTTASVTVTAPSYTYGNVAYVGGGYVDGIVVHPTAANVRYAKTDVGGVYRWNQATSAWVPLTDSIGRANFELEGCESIGLDPSNSNNLYLAMGQYTESYGPTGEFLISTNQGASFTAVPVSFKMGSNDNGRTAGERLAVDPNLGTKLYYGSYKDGLWVSTNSGSSWSKVSTFPVYSTTTGAAGTGGTNAGSSTGFNGAGIVFVDFVASSGSSGSATPVIYVGVSDTGTSGSGYSSLYVSINSGSTWTAVPGQPTGYYPIRSVIGANASGPNNILYVAFSNAIGPSGVTGGALYSYVLPPSTSPGGTGTWTNITPGTSVRPSGTQGGFASIAADPNNPGVIMATTLDDYYPGDDIYRSINYGATWNSVVYKQGATFNTSLSPWLLFGGSSTSTGTWPSSLVIDPANSDHIMYGTGQTLWDSTNIQVSDSGGKATFNVGASGIEETVVQALISPPSGPYVISGVGDLGGFVSTSLTTSPASGMIENPRLDPISSLDFAQSVPATIAFVGSNGTTTPFGAYSTNSGSSFTPFAAQAPGTTTGGGAIAVSANGGNFVWAPGDAPVAYSTNKGSTWTASTGATQQSGVVADRINSNKFYIYTTGTSASYNSTLQISTNGGQSFANAATALANYSVLAASSAAEGDLWLGSNSSHNLGLFHSTNSGTSFSSVAGFTLIYAIGFGAPVSGGTYPAIYIVGQNTGGTYGFFRSIDEGAHWTQINDSNHQYGYVNQITGDPKTFGTVYIGTGGRGVVLGTSTY